MPEGSSIYGDLITFGLTSLGTGIFSGFSTGMAANGNYGSAVPLGIAALGGGVAACRLYRSLRNRVSDLPNEESGHVDL